MKLLPWTLPGKIFAIVIGFYWFNRLSLPYRIILFQVILAFTAECCGGYLAHYYIHNAWVFNIYNLTDLILTGIAGRLLLGNIRFANTVYYLIVLMTVVWGIEVYTYGIHHLATLFFTGTCIVLVVLYVWILFMKLLFTKRIMKEPVFWLSISVILYFGCCLPYFGLYNYLMTEHSTIMTKLIVINRVLNFLRYPLIGTSFIMAARQYQAPVKMQSSYE